MLLEIVLTDADATVRTARAGREALEVLGNWKPDVLLLDISMPDMDGFDLLAVIRNSEGLRGIPAVAITGYTSGPDRERAFSVGFNAFLRKPFSADALVDLVEWLVTPLPRRTTSPARACSSVWLP